MNKVITIHLDGAAYQLEEGGYDILRAYLETAGTRLKSNPDRDEILSDIERAIAEKFRALLGNGKTVVLAKEVENVVAEMGPIEADPGEASDPGASGAGTPPGAGAQDAGEKRSPGRGAMPKRLYRISDGAMLAGVCNGLAAYFNFDPTLVRLAFVLLTMLWGTGAVIYLVMAIVVPEAQSPEEKAAVSGAPSTAQEFIRRAKEGYYAAMKGFHNKAAQREWRRRFKREMRAHADQWRCNWQSYWGEHAPIHPGMPFALPLLSLLQAATTLLWFCALISLLATGTIFGLVLSTSIPVWAVALLLCFAYGLLVGPLKLARRSCYWGLGRPNWIWSFVYLFDAVIWLATFAALLWLAAHFFPELREAVRSIPSLAHQAVDDIRNWWNSN